MHQQTSHLSVQMACSLQIVCSQRLCKQLTDSPELCAVARQ